MNIEITAHAHWYTNQIPYLRSISFMAQPPKICPHCGIASQSRVGQSYAFFREDLEETQVFSFFHCDVCDNGYIGEYSVVKSGEYFFGDLIRTFPPYSSVHQFSDDIQKVSPLFVEIFHQSEKAEQAELNEICGMGYRKAIEFLIKDYCCLIHPNEVDKISRIPLMQCINEKIESEKIKNLAKASTWIGNNESHYERRDLSKSVPDMKRFIKATVTFIESELAVSEATDFIFS